MAGLNNSIFDIPSSIEQIRRSEDVIKISTRKIIPKSASKDANFPSSTISFDWTVSANSHWIPSRSYVVIRDRIFQNVGNAATQPTVAGDVAPAFNCQDNLWDSVNLTIGGFSLGSKSHYCPQISAVNKRLLKSKSWVDGAGKSVYTCEPNFDRRKADIASDGSVLFTAQSQAYENLPGGGTVAVDEATGVVTGTNTFFTVDLRVGDIIQVGAVPEAGVVVRIASNTSLVMTFPLNTIINAGGAIQRLRLQDGTSQNTARANLNERLYSPPIGIWRSGKALPPARYELHCTPFSDQVYKQSAVQSQNAALTFPPGAVAAGADLTGFTAEYNIEDIYLIVAIADNYERPPDKATYVLDLEETDMMPRKISGDTVNENYTVSKSTFALSVALADGSAGRNTLWSPSRFVARNAREQSITSLRMDYAGQSLPNPPAEMKFEAGLDHFSWYGYGNKITEDLSMYDVGGAITKRDWLSLGPLFHKQFKKTGDNISTNVDIQATYAPFTDVNERHDLLLFYHYRRVAEFTIENNQVTTFLMQDA